MTDMLPSDAVPAAPQPVLIWSADEEESHVAPTLEAAAEFLGASREAVVAAIDSGEVLDGWFVDWDASGA